MHFLFPEYDPPPHHSVLPSYTRRPLPPTRHAAVHAGLKKAATATTTKARVRVPVRRRRTGHRGATPHRCPDASLARSHVRVTQQHHDHHSKPDTPGDVVARLRFCDRQDHPYAGVLVDLPRSLQRHRDASAPNPRGPGKVWPQHNAATVSVGLEGLGRGRKTTLDGHHPAIAAPTLKNRALNPCFRTFYLLPIGGRKAKTTTPNTSLIGDGRVEPAPLITTKGRSPPSYLLFPS